MTSSNLQASVLAVGLLCLTSAATSQEPWRQPTRRQYNGWSAAGGSAQQSVGVQAQQAMYQAPGIGGNLAGQSSLTNMPPNNYSFEVSQAQAQTPYGNSQVLPPNTQVLPPSMPSSQPSALTAGASGPLATTDLSSANSLRQIPAQGQTIVQQSNAVGSQIRPIQPGYVTGPPFVSAAPTPRVGNFPTSPYQSWQYQQISYPGTTVARPAQFQTPAAQPAAVLPQNQPVVGIYPTAYQNCAPGVSGPSFPATGAVPGTIAPPTLPPNLTPGLYSPNNSGFKPLISLGQERYNVLLGRGIVGQPTVYVPGQPLRNFLRYLSP